MQRERIKTIEPKKQAIKEWDAYLEVRTALINRFKLLIHSNLQAYFKTVGRALTLSIILDLSVSRRPSPKAATPGISSASQKDGLLACGRVRFTYD